LCAPEWWPAERGRAGSPLRCESVCKGFAPCKAQTKPNPLPWCCLRCPAPAAGVLALPLTDATLCGLPLPLPWCGAPVLALVPVLAECWPCPCSMPLVRPCAHLIEQAHPLTCEPCHWGPCAPEWWPADKGAGGVSFCAANRCARLLHHARYKPSPPVFDLVNAPAYLFKCPAPALLTTSMTGR
jgi:hypothetical protein